MCNISVDVSKAPCIAGMSRLGFPIYIHPFEVIYIYGETEFKAQVSWEEDVRSIFDLLADTLLTNFTTGHRKAVRLSGRDALCVLTSFQ